MELRIEKLHNQAVDAALAHNWHKAIELNKKILEIDDENVDALLALSFAYMETGDLKRGRQSYKTTLKLDPTNIIARNNSEKINILLKKGDSHRSDDHDDVELNPDIFINIKGKTRAVTLMKIGQAGELAKLKTGEKVELKIKKRHLEVRTRKGEYIGCLPDDVSKRLIFFLEAHSVYTTYIKSATKNSVDVFIREEKRGPKVDHYISFPDNIQDDMKMFIGKESEDEDGEPSDDEDATLDEDDTVDQVVDDFEELANADDDAEEYFGIHTTDEDDDFEE